MPLAYLINIVDSTLVYTVVLYHIGTFDRCICRINNDRYITAVTQNVSMHAYVCMQL